MKILEKIHAGIAFLMVITLLTSCEKPRSSPYSELPLENFDTNHFSVPVNETKIRGQLLYMPVYSSVPYHEEGRGYPLSAFLSLHNTDFSRPIQINKLLFFNTQGRLVKDYLTAPARLNALQTRDFFVPESDTSGFGANFIVEWTSDSLVSAPLIESVMIGITNGQGISFLSQGRVLGTLR